MQGELFDNRAKQLQEPPKDTVRIIKVANGFVVTVEPSGGGLGLYASQNFHVFTDIEFALIFAKNAITKGDQQ